MPAIPRPRRTRGLLHVLWALACLTAGAQEDEPMPQASPPRPDGVLAVGSEKQLLVDDLLFASSTGIALKVHPPRKTGEHNLVRDRPWESATLNWFSVLQDAGTYRLWYECYDVDGWPTADDTSFCCAESADGIHWDKPSLGLMSYQGSDATNILFRTIGPDGAHSRVHGTQVVLDPAAPAAERYKAVSQGVFAGSIPPHRVAGMISPDGLHWTRLPAPICDVPADSQYSLVREPGAGTYSLYGRVSGRGRAIGRAQSQDFAHFGPLALVMQTDDQDPPDCDLYNPAVLRYAYAAGVYLAFPSLYNHRTDTLDIRLAVSRDGVRWSFPQRVPFIALGSQGEFDSGSLYMGQGMLRRGDELWQFYSGSRLKHEEAELENLIKPAGERIYSRVVGRLDGFVSADAGPDGGEFTTPPLAFSGDRLELNVQVRAGGELRVGLVDADGQEVPGFSLSDCEPVTGDHIAARVTWRRGADLGSVAGRPVRLVVRARDASLYAFQFTS